jgi:hypothetical protein
MKQPYIQKHEIPMRRGFKLLDRTRNELVLLTLLAEWLVTSKRSTQPSDSLLERTKKVLGVENG